MGHSQQTSFFKTNWKHHLCHGGSLRKKRAGRGQRPLSTREPLHVVFKVNRAVLRHKTLRSPMGHALIHNIVDKYGKKFFVKIEQISVQGDHCHLLVRAKRRSKFHDFFRVVAGQIAQRLQLEGLLNPKVTDAPADLRAGPSRAVSKGTGLWKYRPFSRVVRGWRCYKIVRDYIQLNELEALGKIPYRQSRLRGMSSSDWDILWN
jgi:putative transposase